MTRAARVILSLAGLLAVPVLASAQGGPAESFVETPGPLGPLKGTLLAPPGKPAAALLIIPGSGPTDRDGNNPAGVKAAPYRLLAEALAARHVTTLRIDKRGMFASAAAMKDANDVTVPDYVHDTQAWVDVLNKQAGTPCAWVLGHSEGGLVALAGAKSVTGVCGYVLVATPGRRLSDVLRAQLQANPANQPLLGPVLPAIAALEKGERVDPSAMHPAFQGLFNPGVQGFLISLFSYDPAQLATGLTKPVLVLQGQRDLQVTEADARLLAKADPQAKLVLLPAVNHVLKAVATDDPRANMATYADPSLPLAPGVVDAIAGFVTSGGK